MPSTGDVMCRLSGSGDVYPTWYLYPLDGDHCTLWIPCIYHAYHAIQGGYPYTMPMGPYREDPEEDPLIGRYHILCIILVMWSAHPLNGLTMASPLPGPRIGLLRGSEGPQRVVGITSRMGYGGDQGIWTYMDTLNKGT